MSGVDFDRSTPTLTLDTPQFDDPKATINSILELLAVQLTVADSGLPYEPAGLTVSTSSGIAAVRAA
jgi:hypothetical protein